MKKILTAGLCVIGMTMSVWADYGMRGVGELPINDTASWGGNPLTDNTNYRMGSTGGTTGTVSSTDNFTLMGAAGNVMLVGDITDAIGVIKMDGGTFNLAGKLRLGASGTGTGVLNLSGGTLNTGGDLEVARFNGGATGTMSVSGGSLNVTGNILVGNDSISGETAVVNYTGGSISASGQFQVLDGRLNTILGLNPISCSQRQGANGGALTARISLTLPGGYTHTAGTTNVLISSTTAGGTFTLEDQGTLIPMNNNLPVTVGGYRFRVVNTASELSLVADGTTGDFGMNSGPINDYTSWGGPLTADTNYRLRGTGTVSSDDDFTLTYAGNLGNVLLVGDQAGNDAKVNMDGGNFTIAGNLRLGANSTASGTLNLSNGTLNVQAQLQVARFNAGTSGTVNMSGGTLDVGTHILIGSDNISGETAVFNYTGGSISAGQQFQMLDGQLNFTLGLDPITCQQWTGTTNDSALIAIQFPGGYIHEAVTNVLISSATNAPDTHFTLVTDSGSQAMVDGDTVTISGYDFEVMVSATEIALASLTQPPSVGFSFDGTNLVVSAANLSAGAASNVLQSTETLVNPSWSNLYSVSGITSTNWTITPSKPQEFFRIREY